MNDLTSKLTQVFTLLSLYLKSLASLYDSDYMSPSDLGTKMYILEENTVVLVLLYHGYKATRETERIIQTENKLNWKSNTNTRKDLQILLISSSIAVSFLGLCCLSTWRLKIITIKEQLLGARWLSGRRK